MNVPRRECHEMVQTSVLAFEKQDDFDKEADEKDRGNWDPCIPSLHVVAPRTSIGATLTIEGIIHGTLQKNIVSRAHTSTTRSDNR